MPTPASEAPRNYAEALCVVAKLGADLIESRDLLAQAVDTLRAVLAIVEHAPDYPWDSGALKRQIREDITAYELLGLDWPVERAS